MLQHRKATTYSLQQADFRFSGNMPLIKIPIRTVVQRYSNHPAWVSDLQTYSTTPRCSSMEFMINPADRAHIESVIRKTTNCFRPIISHSVVSVAALVAGPAIKNAIAAPGEAPRCIKPAAIGTEAVAHT